MKNKTILGLIVLIILTASATYAQQQFTHTVTAKNKYCNSTCSLIDIPALNNNAAAIIIVTPIMENSRNPNQHPVGVFYAEPKKWSIINLDGTAITEGARFNIQYYPNPNANQFVYVIPKLGGSTCIDHVGLNNNPQAKVNVSATGSQRGTYFNPEEVKVDYDASTLKWCLASLSNSPLRSETAYNIVISSGTVVGSNTSNPTGTPYVPVDGTTTFQSAPLAPPTVVLRAEWTIPFQSNVALAPGFCKVINGMFTNPSILITDNVIVTGHQYHQGANLRWSAEVDNGSIQITVCNNANSVYGSSAETHLNEKKVNILVLR